MTLPGAEPCQTRQIPTPSGRRVWVHGDECRVYPGKIISPTAPWHDGEPEAVCEEGRRTCRPVMRGSYPQTAPDGTQWMVRALFHADDCPAHPGERINVREYAKGRTFSNYGWRGRRW